MPAELCVKLKVGSERVVTAEKLFSLPVPSDAGKLLEAHSVDNGPSRAELDRLRRKLGLMPPTDHQIISTLVAHPDELEKVLGMGTALYHTSVRGRRIYTLDGASGLVTAGENPDPERSVYVLNSESNPHLVVYSNITHPFNTRFVIYDAGPEMGGSLLLGIRNTTETPVRKLLR